MFGPWIETYIWLKGALPDLSGGWKFKIPHISFNYIMLHYTYLLALTIIGSVVLFGAGNMAYIDALFFASGCATQSGLNTIDINTLYLYQQIAMMMITCVATPIFINTMVVFVRLYWFEKRFQHVVLEAQRNRRTRDRSRTKSQSKDDTASDMEQEERGVGRRKIVVMHPGSRTMSLAEHHLAGDDILEKDNHTESEETSAASSSAGTATEAKEPASKPATESDTLSPEDAIRHGAFDEEPKALRPARAITFADEAEPKTPARPYADDEEHFPTPRSSDQHVSFLQQQRDRRDKRSLYIPGPKDFERGHGPEEIEEEDPHDLSRVQTGAEGSIVPARRRYSDDDESSPERSRHPLRKRLTNKLSIEDASQALHKAKLGVVTRFRHHAQHDGADNDEQAVEKFPEPHEPSENATPTSLRRRGRASTFGSFVATRNDEPDPMPYLSYQATLGRNSAFVDLTEEQREELGGIEYRALKTLASILCCYYVGFHLLAMVCLTPWITESRYYSNLVREDGVNPVWWGFFTAASLFNDLGFTLTPDSMSSFNYAVFPLLFGSFLIIIGNTGFPCMLRFVIWLCSKLVPRGSSIWEELRFLLDHPRRCFTLLFPSKANWWLFWVLVLFNVIDLVFFIILDLHDPVVTDLPAGIQVLDGWFQATSTRTAGFAVVNLAALHPGVQVSYLIMMYISIFPIAISVRNTNVYEEKALGVYHPEAEDPDEKSSKSFVSNHLRRQLSFDLWYVFLGLFLIAIIEGQRLQNTNEYAFTIFSVLFEVVSAYGTVGLSLGYPGFNSSFSGQFHTLSKLVIIAMQIRGRHRGLPYALDKAILLPSEDQQRKEAEDAEMRDRIRRASVSAQAVTTGSDAADDGGEGPLPAMGIPRTQTGRSSISESGTRKKRNNIAKLVGQVFTAGPVHKHE